MKRCIIQKIGVKIIFIIFLGLSLVLSGKSIPLARAEIVNIQLGTSKEGTQGYASGVGVAACIKKRLKDIIMTAVPTPGSTASVKIFSQGGVDTAYASTWTLRDAYNNTGPFEKSPIENKPLQGWYYIPADWIVIVEAGNEEINSLNDLKGKKFFPCAAGTGIHDVYRSVLIQLGLWDEIQARQIDMDAAADALRAGTIDAVGAYTDSYGSTAPPWVRNLESRMEIKIIVPSSEEQKRISEIVGLTAGKISNQFMRPANQKINPTEPWAWSVHFGFHPGKHIPTEIMYNIYKTWIEYAEEDLAPVNASLKEYSKNPLKIQTLAIEEAKDIPVHPGVAKYLKEKGVWEDDWKIGELNPGVE